MTLAMTETVVDTSEPLEPVFVFSDTWLPRATIPFRRLLFRNLEEVITAVRSRSRISRSSQLTTLPKGTVQELLGITPYRRSVIDRHGAQFSRLFGGVCLTYSAFSDRNGSVDQP